VSQLLYLGGGLNSLVMAIIGDVVLALAAYLAAERRAAEPLTPLHLFRSPAFAISAASRCSTSRPSCKRYSTSRPSPPACT
jgi:hypothetical protein